MNILRFPTLLALTFAATSSLCGMKVEEKAAEGAASPQEQLLAAIDNNDLAKVRQALGFLRQGEVAEVWVKSPLEIAGIVEEYAEPIDVNAYDGNGQTPLLRALHNSNVEIIEAILAHKADPFLCDKGPNAQSPLQYATQRTSVGGNTKVMRLIIDAQNKINKAESKKYIQDAIETAQSSLEQLSRPNFDPDADMIIPGIRENLKLLESSLKFLESK